MNGIEETGEELKVPWTTISDSPIRIVKARLIANDWIELFVAFFRGSEWFSRTFSFSKDEIAELCDFYDDTFNATTDDDEAKRA